jgi:hypothetical protein
MSAASVWGVSRPPLWEWSGRACPDFAEKEKGKAEIIERLIEAGIFLSEDRKDTLSQSLDLPLVNQVMARLAGGPAPDRLKGACRREGEVFSSGPPKSALLGDWGAGLERLFVCQSKASTGVLHDRVGC